VERGGWAKPAQPPISDQNKISVGQGPTGLKIQIGYGSVLKLNGKNSVRYVLRHSEGLAPPAKIVLSLYVHTAVPIFSIRFCSKRKQKFCVGDGGNIYLLFFFYYSLPVAWAK